MTDATLRELERRWRETGSPEDEGAFLRERMRAGQLPARTLEILAGLGHAGARVACGLGNVPERVTSSETIDVFRERLAETIVWCETRSVKVGPEALRDPALGNTLPVWMQDPYRQGGVPRGTEIARWNSELTDMRRRLLAEDGWIENARANGLAGGQLLGYSPEINLCDGVAPPVSLGFLDNDNIPGWDTWAWFVQSQSATYLISWIPPSHVPLADAAVQMSAEECITWFTPRSARNTRAWVSDEIWKFMEQLDKSGLV